MTTGRTRWSAGAVGSGVMAGVAWVTFGSAATLTVAPKNASAFRTCILTAYPTTSTVAADSWVDLAAKNSNRGNSSAMQVQSSTNRNNRALLRFDLTKCVPVLAGSAVVKKATVRLALASAPSANRTYEIRRVSGPCPEGGTTCWTENGLTWNNQPTAAGAATSTLALTASSTTNRYYAFDVTADVAPMVAGAVSNYGWRIADSAENAASSIIVTFKTKNASANAGGAPQLVVVYSP